MRRTHASARAQRLLVYSQDGTGLGHLRRAVNLGREFLARAPGSAVLVVGDSPAIPFLAPPRGLDFVKLPTVVKGGDGDWRTGTLALDVGSALLLRARLIVETFSEFRPHVVLVDHMPVGARGELRPMLDVAARTPATRLFLGLRDILDAPDVIRHRWRDLGAYDYLSAYDAVLVYGCREVYDVGEAYGLRDHARRLEYCSYATSPATERAAHARDGGSVVLATGGGGGDAFPLLRTFVEAFAHLGRERDLRAVVLAGPNMPVEESTRLQAASGPGIEVVPYVPEPRLMLGAAAAVVSMAGYNTLCEVLATRRRALVVPRSGPSAEQRIRGRLFAERQLIRTLPPEELSAERLRRELVAVLDDAELPNEALMPPLAGAERATQVILEAAA